MELIYAYTRADALKDGILVDISNLANEAGFKIPVAVTKTVWEDYITPDKQAENYQDVMGRAWDILTMLRYAIRKAGPGSSLLFFDVSMIMTKQHRVIKLKALCHPGDDYEPVITIMLPEED